jgi:putative transposase
MDILALFQCLQPSVSVTTLRQFSRIAHALLAMTGRVTMLGVARWTGKGGSYRTVQRWFYTTLPWAALFSLFFRTHLFRPTETYLLVGDEVVVSKAGKHTFGLDRFFSSVLKSMIPAVSFFALSVVSTQAHCAYPLRCEQIAYTDTEKAARRTRRQAKAVQPKPALRKAGRPKGRKTQPLQPATLTPELQRIQTWLQSTLTLVGTWLPLKYLALDGHFGTHTALQMVQTCGLELISKLRADSALYVPYAGPPPARGRRKYGPKVNYAALPEAWLKETTQVGAIETRVYQQILLHKWFRQPLNVVLIVKSNAQTQKWAHVTLFSSDLTLGWAQVRAYYSLRFQIEFNFRDAKQYWGLDDFMNIQATAVTNSANLSLFMVNVAAVLRQRQQLDRNAFSVLDLKTYRRGAFYALETIKMLPQKPAPDLIADILQHLATFGSIHPVTPSPNP